MEATNSFNGTRIEALDVADGSAAPPLMLDRHYSELTMLDDDRFAIMSDWDVPGSRPEYGVLGSAPVLIVDRDCARTRRCPGLENHQLMLPLDGKGSFLGAGPRPEFAVNPSMITAEEDPAALGEAAGITLYLPGEGKTSGSWQRMQQPDWGGQEITALKLSPDRTRLAVATQQWEAGEGSSPGTIYRVWLLDIAGKSLIRGPRERVRIVQREGADGDSMARPIVALDFTANGETLLFSQGGSPTTGLPDLHVVDVEPSGKARTFAGFSANFIAVGDRHVYGLERQELIDIGSGAIVAHGMDEANVIRAGVIAGSRLFWGANVDGSISFRDSNDGSLQLTLYVFPGNGYFAVAPGGRYDSNLGADTNLVRWVVPDAPWQSLAAQTFMRDYYEPGLYGGCSTPRQRHLRDRLQAVAGDRQPQPRAATGTHHRRAPGSRCRRSGGGDRGAGRRRHPCRRTARPIRVYNPRLFRNGRLVAMAPRQVDTANTDLAEWRIRNRVQASGGMHRVEFTVPLPTQAGEDAYVFSAYAFKRIASRARPRPWPGRAPRWRRARGERTSSRSHRRLRHPAFPPEVRGRRRPADGIAAVRDPRLRDTPVGACRRARRRGPATHVDRATLTRVLALLAGEGDRDATLAALRAQASRPACCRRPPPTTRSSSAFPATAGRMRAATST